MTCLVEEVELLLNLDFPKVYIHDHYDDETKEHDVALVKTKDKITFGSHVAAACLPEQV